MGTTRVYNLPVMVVCLFVVYIYIYIYIYIYTHTHAAKIPNIFFLSGFLYGPWTFYINWKKFTSCKQLEVSLPAAN